MFDRSQLRPVWESIHGQSTSSEQPEKGVIAFAQSLRPHLPFLVLDAGCGRGRNAFYLSQRGFTVCGCDISLPAIMTATSQAQDKGKRVIFQVADLTQLPYADNRFDAVICVHVLPYHLLDDLVAAIGELRRVLRPEGWLYLDLLACDDAEYGRGQMLEEHTFLDQVGVPIHFSSEQEVAGLLRNFTIKQQRRLEHGSPSHTRVVWELRAKKL